MLRALVVPLLIAAPFPALAQNAPRTTGQVAGDIATEPLQDTNIKKREIPVVLEIAAEDPYSANGTRTCRMINTSLSELDAVLGPDFDSGAGPSGTKGGRLAAGVARGVVRSLIPFRGVLREVSGAADAQRRYDAAVDAGIARRGYLRGIANQRKCKRPAQPVTASTKN
jgi:hypothetical protein